MGLPVGKRQGASERATDDEPPVDRQVLAELLQVGDQVRHAQGFQVEALLGGQWTAPATGSLVQADDEPLVGIWLTLVPPDPRPVPGLPCSQSNGTPSGLPETSR